MPDARTVEGGGGKGRWAVQGLGVVVGSAGDQRLPCHVRQCGGPMEHVGGLQLTCDDGADRLLKLLQGVFGVGGGPWEASSARPAPYTSHTSAPNDPPAGQE